MGGPSWDGSTPIDRLRMAASSCFFGEPQYYVEASSERHSGRNWHRGAMPQARLSDSDLKHLNEMLQSIDPQEWRGLGAKERMEAAIDAALAYNVEATLQVAARLRQDDYIRTTPQVILVRAANYVPAKGTGLVKNDLWSCTNIVV